MNEIIYVVKQGEDTYGSNFEILNCNWEITEVFRCVEWYEGLDEMIHVGSNFSEQQGYFETTKQYTTFWIDGRKQKKKFNFVVRNGFYIYWRRQVFKIVQNELIELSYNCFDIRLVGEVIRGREYKTLIRENEEADTGTPDDINEIELTPEINGIIKAVEEYERNKST